MGVGSMKTIWFVLTLPAVLALGISREIEFAQKPAFSWSMPQQAAGVVSGRETEMALVSPRLSGNPVLALAGVAATGRVIGTIPWNVVTPFVLALVIPGLAFAAGVAAAATFFFIWRMLGNPQAKDDDATCTTPATQEAEDPHPACVNAPPVEPPPVEPPPVEAKPVEPPPVEPQLVADVVKSLFEIHDTVYRRLVDGGDTSVFDTVESEILRNGFEIIKPAEGDKLDGSTMIARRRIECPSDDKADCVAQVDFCGFRPSEGFGWDAVQNLVFQKCRVAVYRKSATETKGTNR